MGKEKNIKGYLRLTLDKLLGIRADLVRLEYDNWQEWRFLQLVEALRKWCERNPVSLDGNPGRRDKGTDPLPQAKQEGGKHRGCVYCMSEEHKSVDCDKIKEEANRRWYLSDNKMCFNCPGTRHRLMTECRCTTTCRRCNGKHHSLICDKLSNHLMLATGGGLVVYPVVVVEVDGIRCRALLNMRAWSSDVSAALISQMNRKPDQSEYKRIEMMMM